MNTSPDIKEIINALHLFQGVVGTIQKTEVNPFFKSSYAPISEVLQAIREPLQKAGLCFVQFPSGHTGLTTRLMHTSGEWLEDTIEVTPIKEDPQGQGSAITYARRYSLVAILGLSDGDDDGNEASKGGNTKNSPTTKPEPKNAAESKLEANNDTLSDKDKITAILTDRGLHKEDMKAYLEMNYPVYFKAQNWKDLLIKLQK